LEPRGLALTAPEKLTNGRLCANAGHPGGDRSREERMPDVRRDRAGSLVTTETAGDNLTRDPGGAA
jgi:hypothetical protein